MNEVVSIGCACAPVQVLTKCVNRIGKVREDFLVNFYVNSLHVELKSAEDQDRVPKVLVVELIHGRHHLYTKQIPLVFPDKANKVSPTLVFTQPKLSKVVSTFFRDSFGNYDQKIWFIRLIKTENKKTTILAATNLNVSNFIRIVPKMSEVLVLLNPVCCLLECVRLRIAVSTLQVKCGIQPPVYSEYDVALDQFRILESQRKVKTKGERKMSELRANVTEWLRESLSKYSNIKITNIVSSFNNGIILNALLDSIFPNSNNFSSRYDDEGKSKEPYTDYINLKFALDFFSSKGLKHTLSTEELLNGSSVSLSHEDYILGYLSRIKEIFGDRLMRKSSTTNDESFLISSELCENEYNSSVSSQKQLISVVNNFEDESMEDEYLRKYYPPDPVSILNQSTPKNRMESNFYDDLRNSRFNNMNKPKINYVSKADDKEWYAEDLIADSNDSVFINYHQDSSFFEGQYFIRNNDPKMPNLTESIASISSMCLAPQISFSDANVTINKTVDETQRQGYYDAVRLGLEDVRKKVAEYSDRRKQITTRFDSLKIFFAFLPDHEKRSYGQKDDDLFMKLYAKGRNQDIAIQYVNRSSTQKLLESIYEKFTTHLIINKKLEDYVFENCKTKTVTSDSVMNDLLSCLLGIEELCKEAENIIYIVPGVRRDYDSDIFIRNIDSELTFLCLKTELTMEDRDRECFLLCQRQRLVDLKSSIVERDCLTSDKSNMYVTDKLSISGTKTSISNIFYKIGEFRKSLM